MDIGYLLKSISDYNSYKLYENYLSQEYDKCYFTIKCTWPGLGVLRNSGLRAINYILDENFLHEDTLESWSLYIFITNYCLSLPNKYSDPNIIFENSVIGLNVYIDNLWPYSEWEIPIAFIDYVDGVYTDIKDNAWIRSMIFMHKIFRNDTFKIDGDFPYVRVDNRDIDQMYYNVAEVPSIDVNENISAIISDAMMMGKTPDLYIKQLEEKIRLTAAEMELQNKIYKRRVRAEYLDLYESMKRELKTKAETLVSIIEDLKDQNQNKDREIDELKQTINTLQTRITELIEQLEATEHRISDLTVTLELRIDTIVTLRNEIDRKNKLYEELESQSTTDKLALTSLKNEYETLLQSKKVLENKLAADSADKDKLVNDIKAIEKDSESLYETIKIKTEELAASKTRLNNLQAELSQNIEYIEQVEKSYDDMKDKYNELKERYDILYDRYNEFKTVSREAFKYFITLINQDEYTENEINDILDQANFISPAIVTFVERNKDKLKLSPALYEEEINKLRSDISKLNLELLSLKSDSNAQQVELYKIINDKEIRLNIAETKYTELIQVRDELNTIIKQYMSDINMLKATNSEIEASSKQLIDENASIKSQLEQKETSYRSLLDDSNASNMIINALQSQINALSSKLNTAQEDLANSKVLMSNFDDEIARYKDNNTKLSDELGLSKEELDKYILYSNIMKKKLEEREKEIIDISKEVDDKNTIISNLNREHQDKYEEYVKMIRDRDIYIEEKSNEVKSLKTIISDLNDLISSKELAYKNELEKTKAMNENIEAQNIDFKYQLDDIWSKYKLLRKDYVNRFEKQRVDMERVAKRVADSGLQVNLLEESPEDIVEVASIIPEQRETVEEEIVSYDSSYPIPFDELRDEIKKRNRRLRFEQKEELKKKYLSEQKPSTKKSEIDYIDVVEDTTKRIRPREYEPDDKPQPLLKKLNTNLFDVLPT